jgi:VWFA-related protein
MRKVMLLVSWALVMCAATRAQVQPTPTPPVEDVVRITTNLVQFDLAVTDDRGRVITDLKPDEVELIINGKKQAITTFSYVSSGAAKPPTVSPSDKTGIPLPPVAITAETFRRALVLIIDDLTLSWESMSYAKRAARQFVDEQMQDGDLVAVVRTGSGVGTLQQFTNDKRILLSAIDRIKYNPMGVGGISALEPIRPGLNETLGQAGLLSSNPITAAMMARAEPGKGDTPLSVTPLSALYYIVRGLREFPGRKSVVFFSDGFNIFDTARNEMFTSNDRMLTARRVIEEANRSSVVLYPIDPRGLQATSTWTAADSTVGLRAQDLQGKVDARTGKFKASQDGANYLAEETGGFAFLNNNDLNRGMRRVLDDNSYYLVSYIPESDTFNAEGKYNKVEIRVLRKGAVVRHRRSFMGFSGDELEARKEALPPVTNPSAFIADLQRAVLAPFAANGITVRLNSLYGRNPDNTPFVRSLLHVDAKDLRFLDEKDGTKSCAFDVLATAFDESGRLVDQFGRRYSMALSAEQYKKVIDDGFVYHVKFPVTKPGPLQYRVALRDSNGGAIGSASHFVQVPDIKKGNLTLSSIALEDMSVEDYQSTTQVRTDPMTDTAVRRIKVGRVYRYSVEIYNAKAGDNMRPNVETRIRVFREGQLILDGQPKPFDAPGQIDAKSVRFFGGLAIGSQMEPGDYILQIIVLDKNRKEQIATQFVQFEVAG